MCWGDRVLHARVVRRTVRQQIKLLVFDPELLQGAVAVPRDADDAAQGVVRHAGYAEHLIARTQNAEQRDGQRVRAADEIVAAERVLRAERERVDFIERIASAVAVAVAGRRDKMALADARLHECRLHLLLIVPLNLRDLCEVRRSLFLRRLRRPQKTAVYVEKFVHAFLPLF